jgi:hypothetical protein
MEVEYRYQNTYSCGRLWDRFRCRSAVQEVVVRQWHHSRSQF